MEAKEYLILDCKNNRSEIIKKIILLAVLAAFLVFAFMQKGNFISSKEYFNNQLLEGSIPHADVVNIKGDVELTQSFVAQEKTLNTISIRFYNPDKHEATGKLTVAVKDSSGNEKCSVSAKADQLENDNVLIFEFTGNMDRLNASKVLDEYQAEDKSAKKIKLNKGEEYTVVITGKNIDSPKEIGVYRSEPGSENLSMTVSYWKFLIPVFGVFVVLTLFGAALVLIPIDRIEAAINRKRKLKNKAEIELNKVCLRVMFFLTPFVCYAILSKIADDTLTRVVKHLFTLDGVLNIFVIGFIWWLIYVITNRTKLTIIITTIITFLFGLANYLLYLFRGSQLTATDFKSFGTGMDVIGSYSMVFDKACLWAIMITVIWVCMAFAFRGYKGWTLKKRIAPFAILIAWFLVFNGLVFQSNFLKNHDITVSAFNPNYNYRAHGYALAFTVTVSTVKIDKPEGYNVADVEKVADKYKSDKATLAKDTTEETPNVIAIMNESFSDISVLGDVRLNQDYLPFLHSLKENTVKGTMHSSIFGARTANSEFEFLTGYTCAFLPFGTMAFNGHVKDGTPNLTTVLSSEGYGGITAFHPGKRDSYTRDVVYPNLGFKKHIALEDLKNPGKLRAFVSDEYDYQVVEKEYEKYRAEGNSQPYYMFNVTIQNHANYTSAEGVVDAGIDVLNEEIRYDNPVNYSNLMKKSDEALEDLIGYFSKVKEPTVIVLFGDHQPQFSDFFYIKLLGGADENLPLDVLEKKYQVPFIIWANYDIQEEENVELSANYLAAYMLKVTGGKMSGYDKYLMDLHEKVPVISAICYKGNDGKIYHLDDKSKYTKALKEYNEVQYNGLVDAKNRVDRLFNLR